MSSENIEKLRNQSNQVSLDEINHGIVTLSRTINDARYSTQPRILLELAIVTIASGISAEAQAAPRMTQTQGRPQVTARPKRRRLQNQRRSPQDRQDRQERREPHSSQRRRTLMETSMILRKFGQESLQKEKGSRAAST